MLNKVIDISDWQEGIDLQQVKNEGIYGVIVKLGQNMRETKCGRDFIFKALEVGLKVGVYYYSTATNYDEAKAEGQWVNAKLHEIGLTDWHLQLGCWYDYEESSVINTKTMDENTWMCTAFINEIKDLHTVGVYGGYCALWDQTTLLSKCPWIPIWCAQYNKTCDYPNPKLWQFTDRFDCAGMQVDCSYLYY